jgi:hypothetical protein
MHKAQDVCTPAQDQNSREDKLWLALAACYELTREQNRRKVLNDRAIYVSNIIMNFSSAEEVAKMQVGAAEISGLGWRNSSSGVGVDRSRRERAYPGGGTLSATRRYVQGRPSLFMTFNPDLVYRTTSLYSFHSHLSHLAPSPSPHSQILLSLVSRRS